MLKKLWTNGVWLMWCMALLSAVGAINYPPLAGAQGVESQGLALDPDRGAESLSVPAADQGGVDSYTKLMIHADGSDQGTSFTDSSSGAKTVTNPESYDSYTKLMLHTENNVTDSAAGKTVTNNNVTFSSSAYKMGGYSGVFNGSNAYLSLADSDDWNYGSGNFTIDFWVRPNVIGADDVFFEHYQDGANYYSLWFEGTNNIRFYLYDDGTEINFQGTHGMTAGSWYHVALVRNGNTYNIYVNGTSIASTTSSYTHVNWSSSFLIGECVRPSGSFYDGWIDEFRISKGIARWTSDFTPPSAPYGKVYTVTGTKKFGTASGEFKGSGEYLSLADSDDWNFGTGDFTVDCWVRFSSVASTQYFFKQDSSWQFWWDSSLGLGWYDSVAGSQHSSWSPSINVWYHIAVTRSGTSLKLFVDGAQLGTTKTNSGNITGGAILYIGIHSNLTQPLNGYLDELRISKGIARWTSNFTPPSAPYETDTTAPTVSSTSPASSATGVGVSSAISATFSEDMDSSTITTSTFTLSSSSGSVSGTVSYSSKVATFTPSSNLSYATTYTATITTGVKDIGGNAMSSTYTWSFTTSSTPDTTAPINASISINSGASYTNSTAVTLTLSATDSVGVVGYYLSTSSSTPVASASGWNSVTSATSYSGSVSYTLTTGDEQKTVYVWFKDAAGNVSSVASDSIILDATTPIVAITSPTSSDTYTATSNTVSPSGSASDTTSGVKEVIWSSDKGSSGTASGTTYWSISSVSLSTGDNKITVTAKDNAGNTSTDTITITYIAATKPTVTTGSTSNVTATSATLTGTVNANELSTTAWFEYGTVQGTYGSKSSTKTVTGSNDTSVSITITGLTAETTYYYRAAAQNNSGTSYGSEMTFIYSAQCSMPTVTTESATDVTSTTATLNGTVNANSFSTTAWFEYGKQSGVYGSKSDTKSVSGSTDTKVSISVKNLTSGTTYYFRIVAQNCGGTEYGEEMSFYYTSQTEAPTVATEAATDVTNTSATLNGKCNPNGLSTTAWFEYGTLSGTYEYKTSTQSMSGSSLTKVSATITGLTAGTTYYYRIVAKNSVGTSYGTEMEFYKSPGTDTTPTPFPTLPPLPNPTQIIIPTPPQTGECSWDGSISIQSIDPPEGTVLDVGETYTFTINVKYEFTTATSGNIGVNAQDMDIFMNLDNQFQNGVSVYSRSGEETISVTTNISLNGNPVNAVEVYVSLFPEGYNCSYVNDSVQYKTDAASATPTPLSTLTPLPTPVTEGGIVFGFVNDLDENPLKGVTVTITKKGFSMVTSGDRYNKGRLVSAKSTLSESTETDEDGYYEFSGLSAGEYAITYEKEGYGTQTHDITFEEGELKELETVILEKIEKSRIYGYAVNINGSPIEFVKVKLKGVKTQVIKTASSDADGFFEFADLEADTYVIVAKKKKYRNTRQKVVLEEGESTEIEIEMKKTSKRIHELLLEEDIQ